MNCPLCNSADIEQLESLTDAINHKSYSVFECRTCGIEFSNPMQNPGSEWYAACEFYKEYENPHSGDIGFRIRPFFETPFPKGLSLLDVGCGFGNFLYNAKNSGFICTGIDFNNTQLDYARNTLGLTDLHVTDLAGFYENNRSRKFDVISLFGILEHQSDPGAVLELCKKMLKPGGYLAVNVPNRRRPIFFGHRETWDFPPHHLTRWSLESLTAFVRKHGFTVTAAYDSYLPVEHIYNQLLGIELDAMIKRALRMIKSKLFGKELKEDAPFEQLYGGRKNAAASLFGSRSVRQRPVVLLKAFFKLALLPVTLPAALYFRALKHRGCELFVMAKYEN